MRNKTILWIVLFVLLVSTASAAIGDVFTGIGNFFGSIGSTIGLSKNVNILKLAVNTVLVSLGVYLLVMLLSSFYQWNIIKADSKSGKFVLIIVLLLIGIVIANQMGDQWVWQNDTVKSMAKYLLEKDKGILWPNRILIFLGGTFLLAWLFTDLIQIGQGKNNKVDITIAIILGAEMAYQGVSANALISFGQVLAIFLLYRRLKIQDMDKFDKSAAWWSLALVIWISAIVFPGRGIINSVFGGIVKAWGLWPFLLVMVIGGVVLKMGALARAKIKGERDGSDTASNILDYAIKQPFLEWANRTNIPIIRWLMKQADWRDLTPGGDDPEFSFSIRNIWAEIMMMMNYLLRLEVYVAKGNTVITERHRMEGTYSETKKGQSGEVTKYTLSNINALIDRYKNGTGYRWSTPRVGGGAPCGPHFERDSGGFGLNNHYWYIDNLGKLIQGKRFKPAYGFNNEMFLVMQFFQTLEHQIRNVISIDKPEQIAQEMDSAETEMKAAITKMDKFLKADEGKYKAWMYRRGLYNVVEGSRWLHINQYNLMGEWFHGYKWARPGAPIFACTYSVVPNNYPYKNLPPFEDIDPGSVATGAQVGTVPPDALTNARLDDYEVNRDGFFMKDINAIRIEGRGTPPKQLRRVMPYQNVHLRNSGNRFIPNVIDHPDWRIPLRAMETEWKYYILDSRFGFAHPKSKTSLDYTEHHADKRRKKYRGVKRTHGAPTRGNPAFDREALKDMGRLVYWGKRRLMDNIEESLNVEPVNPFPTLSTYGFSRYIASFVEEFADDKGKEQKEIFVYDSGRDPTFTTKPESK